MKVISRTCEDLLEIHTKLLEHLQTCAGDLHAEAIAFLEENALKSMDWCVGKESSNDTIVVAILDHDTCSAQSVMYARKDK